MAEVLIIGPCGQVRWYIGVLALQPSWAHPLCNMLEETDPFGESPTVQRRPGSGLAN